MSSEIYYKYNDNINLDEQSLFEYVNQQNNINKMISNVGPQNPKIFGQAAEPFGSYNKKSKKIFDINELDENNLPEDNFEFVEHNLNSSNYFKWFVFILLMLLALYFLFRGSISTCKQNESFLSDYDVLTPNVQPEFRAIFVK